PLSTANYPTALEERLEGARDKNLSPEQLIFGAMGAPSIAAARGELPEFRQAWLKSGVTGGNRQVGLDPATTLHFYGITQAQYCLVRGIDDGSISPRDARLAGMIITGALNAIGHWYRPDGSLAPETIAQEFAVRLTEGIAAP